MTLFCKASWTARTHAPLCGHRPYVHRARHTLEEVEEARLRQALCSTPNTGLMPATSFMAKGARGGAFASDLYPVPGDIKVAQTLYTVMWRRKVGHAPQQCPPVSRGLWQHALASPCNHSNMQPMCMGMHTGQSRPLLKIHQAHPKRLQPRSAVPPISSTPIPTSPPATMHADGRG